MYTVAVAAVIRVVVVIALLMWVLVVHALLVAGVIGVLEVFAVNALLLISLNFKFVVVVLRLFLFRYTTAEIAQQAAANDDANNRKQHVQKNYGGDIWWMVFV